MLMETEKEFRMSVSIDYVDVDFVIQMSDQELESIRRKKLLKLKKRLEKKVEAAKGEEEQEVDPREVLNRFLIGRACEVLEAARLQYPQAAKGVEKALVKLILEGRVKEKITGEELYGLFHRLGFRVHLKTRIRIFEHGRLRSLEDKIKERTIR